MRRIPVRMRGADIKEIEIFMVLVLAWVFLLSLTAQYCSPDTISELMILHLAKNYSLLFVSLSVYAGFLLVLGAITYIGKYAKLIGPWLLLIGVYWAILTLLFFIFLPFSIGFGVTAFLTTTCFHLYTVHTKSRMPQISLRRHINDADRT